MLSQELQYVCLSHADILSKWLNMSNVFQSGSHTILVSPRETLWQYSNGDRLTGDMKNMDFRPVSRFISEIIQSRAIGTAEGK